MADIDQDGDDLSTQEEEEVYFMVPRHGCPEAESHLAGSSAGEA